MSLKGVYGPETQWKQRDFRAILSHHIDVCRRIFEKHRNYSSIYRYVDIFGGPGLYDGIEGSPLIFRQLAMGTGLSYQADIFEIDPGRYASLVKNLGPNGHIKVTLGNGCELFRNLFIGTQQYGLLYCDPPQDENTFDRSFELMTYASLRYLHLDLMLYVSATNLKRIRVYKGTPFLSERLKPINKQYWAIRHLKDQQQYTFLIGTNYIEWAKWRKRGFFDVDSPEGKRILEKADLTNDELKKRYQPPLTGLMQSTSDTPNLELSERKRFGGLGESVKDAIKGQLRKFIT